MPAAGSPPEHVVVAPLLGRTGARLTVRDAASSVRLSLAVLPGLLYRITTPADSGLAPVAAVRAGDAEVRFRPTGGHGPDAVRIVLNRAVRWDLRLPAGAGETDLDLTDGRITRLDAGSSGLIDMSLPAPRGTVPVTVADAGTAIVAAPAAPLRITLPAGAGSADTPWATGTAVPAGPVPTGPVLAGPVLAGPVAAGSLLAGPVPAGSVLAEPGWQAATNRYAITFTGGVGRLTVNRP